MVVKGQKWSRSRLRNLLLAVSSQEVLYAILRDKTQVVQQFGEKLCQFGNKHEAFRNNRV